MDVIETARLSDTPARPATTPDAPLAELVGGVLTAQTCSSQVARLALRVQAFDEKLLNLTRLVQLSQGLQREKEAALRAENAELRARLERQETATQQLRRDLAALQASLPASMRLVAETHVATIMRDYSRQVDDRLVTKESETADALAKLQASMHALVEETQQTVQRLPGMEEQLSRLDAAQTRVHATYGSEVESTRQWTRRNMERLKQHLDALRSDLATTQSQCATLSARLEQTDCKAETEYRKLRMLLDRKAHEASALTSLMEKELRQVSHIARQHDTLRTECAPAPPPSSHFTIGRA